MKKIILLFSLFLLVSASSIAQMQQAFFMDNTPVSRTYNVAMKPTWGVYIGIPLSDLNLGVNTTGANYGDIYFKDGSDRKTIFDSDLSQTRKDKFLADIDDDVLLGTDLRITPFALGISIGKSSYGFSVSQRLDIQSNMPRDFFDAILNGTDAVDVGTNMSGLSMSMNTFTEIALSYRRQINDKVAVAIRPKVLSGTGYMEVIGNDLSIVQTGSGKRMVADITGKIAGAMKLTINDNKFDSIKFDDQSFGKNIGFGVDLGATYKLDKLDLTIGVNDLGYIRWKENAQELTGNGYLEVADNENFDDAMRSDLIMTAEDKTFKTNLNAIPYASARYQLTKAVSGGALLFANKIGDKYKPFLTLGANLTPTRFLEAAVTYTLRDQSYTNLGAAVSIRLGGLQIYLATDNLLSVINPEKANYFNVRTGLNFVFGQGRALKREEKARTGATE